jgi:hypothetical protein
VADTGSPGATRRRRKVAVRSRRSSGRVRTIRVRR